MPKSKRSKVVSLTAVKANRKDAKRDLVDHVRDGVDAYPYAYVFAYDNMRTAAFKSLRTEWADSRFFLGKNRVMQVALGDSAADAHRPELHRLAADLVGNVGLLLSRKEPAAMRAALTAAAQTDYARAGFIPADTIRLPAGRLEDLPHTMHDTLRKLGMPVRLERGVIVLMDDFTLCRAGERLTPEQGRLLKHFGHALATFQLHLVSMWHAGKYTNLGYVPRAGLRAALGGDDDSDAEESDAEEESADEEEEEEEEVAPPPAPAARGGKKGAAAAAAAAAPAPAPAPAPKAGKAAKAAPAPVAAPAPAAGGAGGKSGKKHGSKKAAAGSDEEMS